MACILSRGGGEVVRAVVWMAAWCRGAAGRDGGSGVVSVYVDGLCCYQDEPQCGTKERERDNEREGVGMMEEEGYLVGLTATKEFETEGLSAVFKRGFKRV
jgi:hypothetical protein